MPDDKKPDWGLILRFDDPSPSFALGFQAGQIWEKMASGEPFEDQFSGEILELVQRMPVHKDYKFTITESGHGWYHVVATPNDDWMKQPRFSAGT